MNTFHMPSVRSGRERGEVPHAPHTHRGYFFLESTSRALGSRNGAGGGGVRKAALFAPVPVGRNMGPARSLLQRKYLGR